MVKEKRKKILYLQFTNPAAFPPLENSSWLLAESGWKVKFLGTEALGVSSVRFPFHPNIEVCLAPYRFPGILQKFFYGVYLLKAFKEILLGDYRCVYVSDLFSCPVGWVASRVFGATVLYHEHDTPDAPQTKFTQILHWTRKKLSASAKIFVFPQQERAKKFLELVPAGKLQICHNMPLKNRAYVESKKKKSNEFRLWYHGSLVPTLLPFEVLEALSKLPKEVSLHFAGYEILGFPDFLRRFFNRAEELGVESRVFFEGALSREPLYEKARSCDLGLSLFSRNFREPMVGASNKPFDYMACGLPLLINDTHEWRDFFETLGVAKKCNPESGESIAQAIEEIRQSPELLQQMRETGVKKIESEWNYETQFAPIQRLLESTAP